jgi:hypothetical protein
MAKLSQSGTDDSARPDRIETHSRLPSIYHPAFAPRRSTLSMSTCGRRSTASGPRCGKAEGSTRTGKGPILGHRHEIEARRRDGKEIRVDLSITALRRRDGVVLNGFVRDLTEGAVHLGYTENAIIHHGRLDTGVLMLAKPYRKSDMAGMIRKALAGQSRL